MASSVLRTLNPAFAPLNLALITVSIIPIYRKTEESLLGKKRMALLLKN
ncbi:MAG: hypothetical protein HXX81_01180 [Campylobacterales bacterium]|nr:hypothetical protein [Campylobacterales bacterium]